MASNGLASTPEGLPLEHVWATRSLLGTIVRLNLAVSEVFERITAEHGLTMSDYLVLGVIRGAPGAQTSPGEIVGTLGRTSGGMTLTLDRLAHAGLVKRSKDPSDGRRSVVELTDDGLRLALEINHALHSWEQSLALEGAEGAIDLLDQIGSSVKSHSVASV